MFKPEHHYDGYLKTDLIDHARSWAIQSRHNINGSALVFQHVEMTDGTVYHLRSWTASTRGIEARVIAHNVTQREVKEHFTHDTIRY